MEKIILNDITLLGIDCVDAERLLFVAEVCQKHIQFGAVKILTSLPHKAKEVVQIEPLTSIEQYSYFMMKELYKYIHTTHVLIIQWDGFILNPFCWTDKFLEYDYIGACWEFYDDNYNVGNGGFSLRSKKLMETVALDQHIINYHPEDDVICRKYGQYLRNKGFHFASKEMARKFSVEGLLWGNQFGFHKSNISNWDIHQFVDKNKHAKYINLFMQLFGNGAEVFYNIPPGINKL